MIIGITGLISSGKDTAADYLIRFHGFKKLSYAGTLKDTVAAIFGWNREMLEGTTQSSRAWREEVDQWWADRLQMPHLTPRWVLQYWGTEVGRRSFHNDIWVASVENQLRHTDDSVVITDCRFANELDAIKNAGGTTIRVERGVQPDWLDFATNYNITGNPQALAELLNVNVHASEYSSVGLKYDHVIDNNGTIDDLHKSMELIVNG
jgi:hypothetical protein